LIGRFATDLAEDIACRKSVVIGQDNSGEVRPTSLP